MQPASDQPVRFDPRQKAVSLFEEFKKFALKGNVIDLAVGVVIGTSFARIIDALVKSIIMPVISLLLPTDQGYVKWQMEVGGKVVPYGQFLGEVVNFLIVALALWLFIVKFLGWVMRTKKEMPPPPPTKEQELLTEIRDLLKRERAQPE